MFAYPASPAQPAGQLTIENTGTYLTTCVVIPYSRILAVLRLGEIVHISFFTQGYFKILSELAWHSTLPRTTFQGERRWDYD